MKARPAKRRASPVAPLPALGFDERRAIEFQDAELLSDTLTRTGQAVVRYRPQNGTTAFRSRAAIVRMERARLVALATSAMISQGEDAKKGLLLVPLRGVTRSLCDDRVIEWGGDKTAVLLPPTSSSGEATPRSVIGVDIEPARLEAVARTMTGGRIASGTERLLDLTTPRALELNVGRLNFAQIYQQQAAIIDLLDGNGAQASRAGVDDTLLRATVMLLAPELFFADHARAGGEKSNITIVQDYIDAHLTQRVTLSDLEAVSGLSARGLQYAFRAALGVTPMQWLAARRRDAVRRRLLAAVPGETVTAIASDYFVNLGEFARLYHQEFGEYPSQTLKAAQSRRLTT